MLRSVALVPVLAPPTLDEVACEPLTPEAIARLADVDVESASDAEVVALMADWGRVRAYADGQIARAVLVLRERARPAS